MKTLNARQKLSSYLVPPGDGVFTVHTGREKKASLAQLLWGTKNSESVQRKFQKHLLDLPQNQAPMLLGICSDSGGGILRGADWGPLALRETLYQSLAPKNIFELGDVRVIPHLLHDKYLNQKTIRSCRKALYKNENVALAVSPLSIAEEVTKTVYLMRPDSFILGLGGDHSVGHPLVKSFLLNQKRHRRLKQTALIHFDAHTDLLPSRLGIDFCFGTWAYHVLGYLPDPSHMVQVGIRSSGRNKAHWQNSLGVKQIWAREIEQKGPEKIAQQIIRYLREKGVSEVYLSFDIDALDGRIAGRTGTPEEGGLLPHQVSIMLEAFAEHLQLGGADLVEVAPGVDPHDSDRPDKDKTLEAAQIVMEKILQWQKRSKLWRS